MKGYVITIKQLDESVRVAQRCIDSAKSQLEVEMFDAFTPQDNPDKLFEKEGLPTRYFNEMGSKRANCMAAFFSHYSLWKKCDELNEEIYIFEHDAVVKGNLPPEFLMYQGCISVGQPSYGKFNTPTKIGVGPLVSKTYFPGAHAYRIKPSAARIMIEVAKDFAGPTDVFLRENLFHFLEEYYPWPVVARDTFTTIQKPLGCSAKHNYGETYEILNV